jgi:ribonuclease Z
VRSRLFAFAVALAAVAAAALAVVDFSPAVQDAIMRRTIAARVGHTRSELLAGDALRVVFCGTGSPLPDPERAQACTAIFAGGRLLLVDAGAGAAERLQRFRLPQARLEAVLLTHFHSDHVSGVPDVLLGTWAAGRREPLRIFGGPGVEQVATGFQTAMGLDASYRVAHHGAETMPPQGGRIEATTVMLPAGADSATVFDEGGLRVTAFRVRHEPVEPAYGYRIDWGGRAVVLSGDTMPAPSLVAAARDADVLVHEALAPHMVDAVADGLEAAGDVQRARIMRDVPTYHTTPVDAARQANAAHVRLLVLSHVVPPASGRVPERIFLRGVAEVRPVGVVVARDGLLLELPRGSTEIREQMLDR